MTTDALDTRALRGPVLGTHGMVASEHPLVSQTGVTVLRGGGNAFDAALAMSALLPVVKPQRNHLGGDAFILALPVDEARVTAICAGGLAPAAATRDQYANGIPNRGGAACAIPGMVDAWSEFHARWCSRPFAELLAPAVNYARDGFPVSRELEITLRTARGLFTKYRGLATMLYPDGETPAFGQVLRQPALASALDAIAQGGRAAFYEGDLSRQIAEGVQRAGGCMTAEDLARHRALVLGPLATDYRGATVYETPPNSQGLILLEELNIVEGFDMAAMGHLSADSVHTMVEAKKLAFEDRLRHVGDPAFVPFGAGEVLSKEWAARRRAEVDPARTRADATLATSADTTSFVVADGAGNVCSFIQSIYAHFGSAVAIPEAGVIMNNRMCGFSLDPASPNVLAPGKRTMHTLNTYLVFREGRPWIIGNTPGADFQVQTNLQVLTGIIDYGLDPQAAVDAPRWGHSGGQLLVEDGVPQETQAELSRLGHDVRRIARETSPTGRAQCIVIDAASGALVGGSDIRGEGAAAGW